MSVEEEDDCGFKFRRISKITKPFQDAPNVTSKDVRVVVPSNITLNATEVVEEKVEKSRELKNSDVPIAVINEKYTSKEQISRVRRRRSSFASIVAARTSLSLGGTGRKSSFSATLSQRLPPASVMPADYHKHLFPDLPGPLKMKQLLVWSVQNLVVTQKKFANVADDILQQLFENKINTSWYQRSVEIFVAPNSSENRSGTHFTSESLSATVNPIPTQKRGPKYQELLDCIELYERYISNLEKEKEEWNLARKTQTDFLRLYTARSTNTVVNHAPPEVTGVNEISQCVYWLEKIPESIDRLQWTLSVISSFEGQSRTFCERVFHQIRSSLFAANEGVQQPMALLRALTSAKAN